MSPPAVSVAVPVFNEIDALPELHRRLEATMESLELDWELVVADDGSTDGTRDYLRGLATRDARVKAVLLSRNFGHTPAYLAALERAAGSWTVVMDGDLQDQPEAIPLLLETARADHDVVYAIKTKRTEGVLLRLAFSLYYRLAGMISTVPQPAHAGPFCVMSRRVVDEITSLPERNLFFPGVRAFVGFRQTGVDVQRGRRAHRASSSAAGSEEGSTGSSPSPTRRCASPPGSASSWPSWRGSSSSCSSTSRCSRTFRSPASPPS